MIPHKYLAEISASIEEYKANYEPTHLKIYRAALSDDWDAISHLFVQNRDLLWKPISQRLETPLMIAVGTNRSHNFVNKLLNEITQVSTTMDDSDRYWYMGKVIGAGDCEGNTALHYAAKAGNLHDARRIVPLSEDLCTYTNFNNDTPLTLAASLGRRDVLEFLMEYTDIKFFEGCSDLVTLTIEAEMLDIALKILDKNPRMEMSWDFHAKRALNVLAAKPQFFPSGSKLGFCGRMLYSLLPIKESNVILENKSRGDVEMNPHESLLMVDTQFKRILRYLPSPIANIYDIKVKHIQAKLLGIRMCNIIIESNNHKHIWDMLGSAIAIAVRSGAHELIEQCIMAYPSIIWYNSEGFHLFHSAIRERQVQVYNLVYQMSNHKAFIASQLNGKQNENALHIAAKLAPPHRLNTTTGAALQMQRELQWFKEIENFVEPSYREALNKNKKSPRMLFTREHKNLLKEGHEWMKVTASSCTVVVALIVTMAFAAAFTVPGGVKDDGKPLFLNNITFMLFIISDAIALFSSSTSVLMFLGILTSRYAEDDFLYALPKRLMIGLVSLFMSLIATLIASSAALALLLEDKVTWIAAPLVIVTSIPVYLFCSLQFPLLRELRASTYGQSIFRKQNDRMIR